MLRKLIECLAACTLIAVALMALLGAVDPVFGSIPDVDQPSPYLVDNNVIPKIVCGPWMGSGVYIGGGLIVTARHVVSTGKCTVGGHPATVVQASLIPALDYALLHIGGRAEFRALIDCGGFQEGERYLATGYAEDAHATVSQILTASNAKSTERGFAGLTILRGAVTQGMSGGPVTRLDNGALVGIINANSGDGVTQVLSLALADTPLCKKG